MIDVLVETGSWRGIGIFKKALLEHPVPDGGKGILAVQESQRFLS